MVIPKAEYSGEMFSLCGVRVSQDYKYKHPALYSMLFQKKISCTHPDDEI